MRTPGALKGLASGAKSRSASDVALTVAALVVLGVAIAELEPGTKIQAAEAALSNAAGFDTAEAQGTIGQSDVLNLEQSEQVEVEGWGTAFGTTPSPPPMPEPEPEPVVSEPLDLEPVETVETVARDRSDDYWLTGHIIAGADSVAIVHDGGEEQVVRLGSALSGGEVVTDISSDGVIAEYAGQSFLIVLRDNTPPMRATSTDRRMTPVPPAPSASRAQSAKRSFLQQARSDSTESDLDDEYVEGEDWDEEDTVDEDWYDEDWDADDDNLQ